MSDIGLTGVPTTRLNKVGSMGEILPGNVNDTTSSLSPFGPGNKGIPQTGVDDLGNQIRNVDFSDLNTNVRDMGSRLQDFLGGFLSSFGKTADLKYPLETENPAYQARVRFTVFTFRPKDGESMKRFAKIANDNLKVPAGGTPLSEDERAFGNAGTGNEINTDNFYGGTRPPDAIGPSRTQNAPAAGGEANSKLLSEQAKGALASAGNFISKQLDKNTAIKVAGEKARLFSGGLKKVKLNEPTVDMYFPLTMQFNDNAQYDNAPLNALGAGTEGLINQGAGALESTIGSFVKGGKSIFDVLRGNQDLTEAGLRVGAARLIDKVGVINSGIANALTLQNRTIINPNMRAMFRGVGLREFTFQFKMIAKSQYENAVIRQIVKHFRKQMYPGTYDIEALGGASIGFKFPHLFQIDFRYKNAHNRNIPKIHLCYLRNVSTTINPTGGAMRRDGAPNEIDLTLSFVEHKTLDKKDIDGGY